MPDLPEQITLTTGETIPLSALEFATSRSGGPGGQNVNKVETKVEVRLTVPGNPWLSEATRNILTDRLATRLDTTGTIRLASSIERSQLGNRIAVVARLQTLLNTALIPRKQRKQTKPSNASKRRRREIKRQVSEKKSSRNWRPE